MYIHKPHYNTNKDLSIKFPSFGRVQEKTWTIPIPKVSSTTTIIEFLALKHATYSDSIIEVTIKDYFPFLCDITPIAIRKQAEIWRQD